MTDRDIVDEIAVSIWANGWNWQQEGAGLNGAACNVLAFLHDEETAEDLRFLARIAHMRDRIEKEH